MTETEKCGTSELLFRGTLNSEKKEKYSEEAGKRMYKLGLANTQATTKIFLKDFDIIQRGNTKMQIDKFLFENPIIKDGMSRLDFNFDDMTFSELVYLSEEADRIYKSGKQGSFKQETMLVITENKSASMGESEAMNACINRLKELGLSEEQINSFIKNEKTIIQKVYDEKNYAR